MKLNEKIKKYRKEKGYSQEDLASKIFVSRTLITKYENGSVFPTQENIEKLANVFNIEVSELLSDKENNEIAKNSYKTHKRFWMILSIFLICVCTVMILLSTIPFYKYSSYDYSIVSYPDNPTPVRITGYASIIGTTLKVNNPIVVINIVLLIICLIISAISLINMNNKILKTIRLISIFLFSISFILFFISFATMVSNINKVVL